MGQASHQIIVFTDLDGTLLDDRYDLQGAAFMLNALSVRGIYTIPASSKTAAELRTFQQNLTYEPPMIVENGAGIVWPQSAQDVVAEARHTLKPSKTYAEICAILAALRARHGFNFSGFADMSVDELCTATGLDSSSALLAQQRAASEPISWADSPEHLADLRAQLQMHGLILQQGGRFWHVMEDIDKGRAADQVCKVLRACWRTSPVVLASGDSANDRAMLEWAEGCVLFPQRDGAYLSSIEGPCVLAKAPGALPWLEALNTLLNSMRLTPTQSTAKQDLKI